jgi:aminoglycoside phosphotransferase (APT) family kinase protein
MMDAESQLRSLARWLADQWPNAQDIACDFVGSPKTGMSNDTRFVDVAWREHGSSQHRTLVLRRAVEGLEFHPPQVNLPAGSIELQHAVMAALHRGAAIPVPDILPLERDPAWLGAPFYLMEYVAGVTLSDFPSFTEGGAFVEAYPELRSRMYHSVLMHLAALHRMDWRAAGASWLDRASDDAPRCPAQMALWRAYCAPIFERGRFPALEGAVSWLSTNYPEEPASSLIWGDARPQNILFDAALQPLTIMDWEGAAILPAEFDFAYWLWSDYFVHERVGVVRRSGVPSRALQTELYTRALGRPLTAMPYFRVLSLMTIVASMFNVYDGLATRGVALPDDECADNNYFSRTLQRTLDGEELW